jgi:hypothetical protein
LVALGLIEYNLGNLGIYYPPLLLGILLMATGCFHIHLASPSWNTKAERPRLVAMGITALVTHNLLWTLLIGLTPEVSKYLIKKTRLVVSHDKI